MPLAQNSRLLSDFREMPYIENFSKARKSGGTFVRADFFTSTVLEKIASKMKHTSTLEVISDNWRICVDAKFADKCFVYNVKGPIVFVSAINAQVKQAISFNEKKILAKIKRLDGCNNITKIRFV